MVRDREEFELIEVLSSVYVERDICYLVKEVDWQNSLSMHIDRYDPDAKLSNHFLTIPKPLTII